MQTSTVVARDELIEFCKMFEDLEQERQELPKDKPKSKVKSKPPINLLESDEEGETKEEKEVKKVV